MPTILPGAPPSAASPGTDPRLRFSGDGGEFVRLCSRGAVFQLLTFGFYRFWLITDIRRHLWSHTSISGEPLEYTGRARELLIGFLIALAILVPVQALYVLAGLQAEQLAAFASLPLSLFYILFGQFAVYRARRYRLTRTIWRGVRFWMSGSGWAYAFRWLGWAFLTGITLGLVYPWMRASLERYKMENTYYGDLRGDFVGRGSKFLRRGFALWLFCVAPFFLLLASVLASGPTATFSGASSPAGVALGAFGGLWIFAIPVVWPWFRALEWRWWAGGVRFGDLELTCDLGGGSLLKNYVKAVLACLLVFIAGAVLLGVVVAILAVATGVSADFSSLESADSARLLRALPAFVGVAIGYLALLLAVGVAQRYYLTRGTWRIIAGSVVVSIPKPSREWRRAARRPTRWAKGSPTASISRVFE